MKTSANGIALIKRFEGFGAEPYPCPAGKLTIGYGHVIRKGERIPERITEAEALAILQEDLTSREKAIDGLVTVTLTQNQFDALVSFVYNIGVNAFAESTMLKRINALEIKEAAKEFDRWTKGTVRGVKTVLPGLVKRRASERKLFETV